MRIIHVIVAMVDLFITFLYNGVLALAVVVLNLEKTT
jgi:hypothetical protein